VREHTVFDYTARSIDGRDVALRQYAGHVLLIVNVASRCGYTPQYAGLERLHRTYAGRGFAVLGFPCNQFGRQEPGRDAEIQAFCASTYGVTFPLFAKVRVNGRETHPLFSHLKTRRRGWLGLERIAWNFTKFLVDREGRSVRRFGPTVTPERLRPEIERALAAEP
jgi:glutathione peroxidase